jgi:hypothetical protein
MKVFRSTLSIFIITLVALVYVHQQVELVKLSYCIDCKEKRLKEMLDHNASLGYNIENLEAPSRLEQVLQAQKINVAFPKRANVINVARAASGFGNERDIRAIGAVGIEKKINILGIFDFLIPRAEAHPKER